MSKALNELHICDRCGKHFDYFDDAITSKHAYLTVSVSYPNWRQHDSFIHLCDDCQEELRKWLEDAHE